MHRSKKICTCPCRHEIHFLKIEKDKKWILNSHNTGCTQLLIQSRCGHRGFLVTGSVWTVVISPWWLIGKSHYLISHLLFIFIFNWAHKLKQSTYLKSAVISQQLSTSTNTSTKDVTEELLFPLGFMRLNQLLQHLGMKLKSLGKKEDILELQHHGVYWSSQFIRNFQVLWD